MNINNNTSNSKTSNAYNPIPLTINVIISAHNTMNLPGLIK